MKRASLIAFVLGIALLGALFSVKGASATINRQISFQGKLTNTDGTNVTDGSYSIRFRIYTDPSADAANSCAANSCKWEETQATVAVAGGLFQVNLGGGTTLPGSVDFNTSALYLGIKVGGDNEMTPRVQLTATPYAMNADLIDGIDGASLVQLSPGSQQTGNINISGTVTSGAVNGLTLAQAADGFTLAGGTTSRTLTVQGANITIGSTIQPTSAGALSIQSNGANALNLDAGGVAGINIGVAGTSVNAITIGNITSNPNIDFNGSGTFDTTTGTTSINGNTTITGTKTLTVSGGLTTLGAGLTFSGTAAQTITGPSTGGLTVTVGTGPLTLRTTTSGTLAVTSAGALSLTGAAASTWDIGANTLSIQTASNGAITTGTGTLTQGGNVTFSGTAARTLTGPSTGGLAVTVASGPLTVSTTTSGTLSVTSAGAVSIGGAAASTWDIGNNTLSLQTTNNGAITTGAGTFTQGGNLTFSGTTARTITGPSTGGLTMNVTSGPLTVSTTTSGALAINSAGTLTLQGSTSVGITSTSGNVTIGTVDGTGTLLVLDTRNATGDPTEIDGGMYYNSANNRFRCGQNGAWLNCIGGTITTNTAASTAVNTCTTACPAFSTTASIPANFCVPGRVFHIVANGVYSTTASTTLAMGVYLGSNATTKTSDVLIGASSGALSSGALVTNIGWGVDFYVSCFTAGASGTVSGQGNFNMATSTTATAAGGRMYSSATTTVNTTTAQTLYLFPAFGASAAGNTATVQQFIVTAM
ncbi:MAG TPA: hypothetical protein VLI54_05170 [Bacillota bacterium]|nr:hypothetical protein [Bacillota bacterium]